MKIALLADMSLQAKTIADALSRAGVHCHTYHASGELFRGIDQAGYDVLLIDHELADMPAVEAVRAVRGAWRSEVPVMVVSDRRDEDSVVNTLQAGADDYMTRPLRARELIARLHALQRRTATRWQALNPDITVGPYSLDCLSREVVFQGRRLALTPREFDLASLLFASVGRVLSHAHIERTIWGYSLPPLSRALASLVSRLRRALELHPRNGLVITVVYGQGYRLDETAARLPRPSSPSTG
ncbi:winged helix family two component transcriptional regulator [Cupriavidus basilensis OR16]|uniref:Winged helix family two component transcriptional regulator n=1 Tax=Cupriavidus basilensis OR16 TaxID=1127483 RepID=H1S9D7_9BURK|nr:response regulator transcription factor [Cupriavidus basilensis]EHP40861.1 winged helix family two component transcriptional regulator [Cupriavidus basilensis OR16]